MERLAIMVADTESKGMHYVLPDGVHFFEVATVLQETKEPHMILQAIESQDPAMLEDPDLAAVVRCRVMMENADGKPSAWVGHSLVKKVLGKEVRVPEIMTAVLDAVSRGQNDFLKKVVTMQVTKPDFFGWDLWAQRVAAQHLALTEGTNAFLPYEPRMRPALMFYVGLGLGQRARNHMAASMEEVLGVPGADDAEINEYAGLLRG